MDVTTAPNAQNSPRIYQENNLHKEQYEKKSKKSKKNRQNFLELN